MAPNVQILNFAIDGRYLSSIGSPGSHLVIIETSSVYATKSTSSNYGRLEPSPTCFALQRATYSPRTQTRGRVNSEIRVRRESVECNKVQIHSYPSQLTDFLRWGPKGNQRHTLNSGVLPLNNWRSTFIVESFSPL